MAEEIRVLTAHTENRNQKELEKLSPSVQKAIQHSMQLLEDNKTDEAETYLREQIDREQDTWALRGILAQVLMLKHRWTEAEVMINGLLAEKEEDDLLSLMGQVYYAEGRYEEAVRTMKKASFSDGNWPPFYNNTLADALYKLGRTKEALQIFRREADMYRRTGIIASPRMLDGTFQNLLVLDTELADAGLEEDLELYKRFLSEIKMDETQASYLASTIVMMSERLNLKWFRPYFRAFIEHVETKGLLDNTMQNIVLPTAHTALESWQYHEDAKIDSLVESFLNFFSPAPPEGYESTLSEGEHVSSLSYQWYMCRYYPDHWQIFDYVKDAYPYTWLKVQPFIQQFGEKQISEIESEVVDKLLPFVKNTSKEILTEDLERTYQKALELTKQPITLTREGETYRTAGRKIMPNDPCPCGSGKKYKKCCGKK